MREYDVELNGVGYMLVKGPDGRLLSSASRHQASDPFMNYVSQGERWKRQSFRFEGGAGLARCDGSPRYAWGMNVDSRSGDLELGPEPHICDNLENVGNRVGSRDVIGERWLSSLGGYYDGFAVQFDARSTKLRTVAILVKWSPLRVYSTAANFTVEIRDDAADTPNAVVGVGAAAVSLAAADNVWTPYEDPWLRREFFWLTVSFSAEITLVLGNPYWLCVRNAQNPQLIWGAKAGDSSALCSEWDGAAWAAGSQGSVPYHKIKYYDEIDAAPRCLTSFRGADDTRRMYAAVGPKVMYYDEYSEGWANSKGTFPDTVEQLLEFNSYLFAIGSGMDLWYTTGATGTTVWATLAGVTANCAALHDNLLWRADGPEIEASEDGTTWGSGTCDVGDPGTPIMALQSHGGKLYAAKPEGIFEINYEDTYPATGDPTADLVLDFRTDKASRPWLLDWHSGLYFRGTGGLYRWKNGVLDDVWQEKMDENALAIVERLGAVLMGYDAEPGCWQAACGTTRGMALAFSSPFLQRSAVWWYDKRGFHPQMSDYWFVGEYVEAVFVESLGGGKGRLWYGRGFDICYVNWPTWTADRSADGDADFYVGGGSVAPWALAVLPRFDDGRPTMRKDFHRLEVHLDNSGITAGGIVYITVYIDGTLFDVGPADLAPIHRLLLPDGTTGSEITINVFLIPYDSTQTMKVKEIVLEFQPLPETLMQYQVWIRAARNQKLHQGGVDPRAAGEIWAALLALLEEDEPWTFTDELEVEHTVRAVGVSKQDTRLVKRPAATSGLDLESYVLVTMIEVNIEETTTPTLPDETNYVDNGEFETDAAGWTLQAGSSWTGGIGDPDPGCLWMSTGMLGTFFYQDIVLAASGYYTLRFRLRADVLNGAGVDISAEITLPLSPFYYMQEGFNLSQVNTWEEFDVEGVALPAGTVRLTMTAMGLGQNVYVDSVELVADTAPPAV